MIRFALLSCLVFTSLTLSPNRCRAALVTFSGTLTTGNGTFGSINPGDAFSLTFNFSEVVPGVGLIEGGSFSSVPGNLTITGGDISLIDNGSNDVASFEFQTAGPLGTLSVAFLGDGLTGNSVTSENLLSIINAAVPAPITGSFGASGNFTGSVLTAVPEPNSAALFATLAAFAGFVRRRRPR